jgi:hypothetical protein
MRILGNVAVALLATTSFAVAVIWQNRSQGTHSTCTQKRIIAVYHY